MKANNNKQSESYAEVATFASTPAATSGIDNNRNTDTEAVPEDTSAKANKNVIKAPIELGGEPPTAASSKSNNKKGILLLLQFLS